MRRTRELLRGALLSLIEEKGYDRITVQDILDRADVGRSTFYAHYRDKEDLLVSGFDDIRSALWPDEPAESEAREAKGRFLEPMVVVFRHVEEHQHRWRPLVRKGGANLVIGLLRDSVTDLFRRHLRMQFPAAKAEDPRVEGATQFVVGACMGLVTWWLNNDNVSYSAEEIHAMFRQLATQGVRRFLATS